VTKDDMEIMSAVQNALLDRVGQQRFDVWFADRARMAWRAGVLTVSVPSQMDRDFVRRNFWSALEAACVSATGRAIPLSLEVEERAEAVSTPSAVAAHVEPSTPPTLRLPYQHSSPARRMSQGVGASQGVGVGGANISVSRTEATASLPPRRDFARLESFVVGTANQLAHKSAEVVSQSPGRVTPLFLHGPTGVGKTHLLEGIWSAARQMNRELRAVYLTAEQFTSLFLDAMHSSGMPNFRRKYRGVDLLLIDDLQFLGGKQQTLIELLHTLDTLVAEGKQVVFAADRMPAELAELGPELVPRLQGGLVCRIDPPEFETRRTLVVEWGEQLGLELEEDVPDLLAERFANHARELRGALHLLQIASQLHCRPIDRSLAEEVLADQMRQSARVIRLPDIIRAVSEVCGVAAQSLCAENKSKQVSYPRMLAMYLARKHTRAPLSEIGKFFGQRSHSSVSAAQKKVGQWVVSREQLRLVHRTLRTDEAVRQVEERLLIG
jgi:chromosomal replication initiator protein